jgi:hypothetical protein
MLTFKRVTVNWPTIELYMSVGCDGKEVYSMTKQNFRILENGVEVPNFTLWCPDPSFRCAASIALVADASASLKGSGLVGMQAGLTAFTQMMDGVVDEAALVSAGNPPAIRQKMTFQTVLLRDGIDSLRASGGSAIWDGAMLGLQHLIDVGLNQCRAVILFTDGMDNLSTTSVAELISVANRHRIRIFTIGFGNVINPTELELLALLTGGRYYQTPNAGQFAAIYQEITATMIGGWYECIITYERDCAEGSMRTVEMQLKDFCGGDDAKTKTYRAPLDSTTFTLQRLRIGESTSDPRDEITVPLLLDYIPGDAILRPFDITITSTSPSRPLIDVTVPSPSPLSGAQLHIDRYIDSVRIRLDEEVPVSATGTLLELHFHTTGIRDSSWFPLGARVQDINVRCTGTIVDSGGYRIVPRLLPRITPEGEVLLCLRGTVELKANEGFVSYRWSTGETTRAIIADTEGPYFVDVLDGSGDTLRSESVFVRFRPDRHVWLEPQGPLTICRESSITFRVAGDTAGTRIFWKYSNRDQRTYQIKASEGVWAKVVDEAGCVFFTDTLWTNAYDPPVTLNVTGTVVYVCPGDSLELSVLEDYPFYYWDAGYQKSDSSRSIFAHADGGHRRDGRYSVYVRDQNGCRSSWHSVTVREYSSRELTFTPAQRLVLCPGEETFFSVAQDFAAYRWSTGDTTRGIVVRAAFTDATDTLWAEGYSDEGCMTRSAPLVVETVSQPKPRITPGALTALCPDDRVLLDAGEGYAAYRWSTGDSTRFLEVGEEGSYTVEVMTHGGCHGISDTSAPENGSCGFRAGDVCGTPRTLSRRHPPARGPGGICALPLEHGREDADACGAQCGDVRGCRAHSRRLRRHLGDGVREQAHAGTA